MSVTKRYLALLLPMVAGALLAGCGEEESPPLYQLVPVSERDIVVSASAAGVIEPILTVDVKSKASGEIMERRADIGDQVRAGQMLIKVDPRVPQNALQQAEADLEVAKAQLANAQSQLRRAEELFKTQSITEQEYETARLQTANANAQLIRAQRSLEDSRIAFEDTEVRAPINGMIITKAVEVGTVIQSAVSGVSGGAILLQMANLDTVQVRSLVDETDIGKIQRGMPVTITVEAYPNRPFRGEVLKIEPQATVQQNVTMFPVLVRIANREGLLKPGMNAEVEVHVGNRQQVLAVPNAALRTQRDVNSAAMVLGLAPETVQQQLAAARNAEGGAAPSNGQASLGGSVPDSTKPASGETMTMGDREIRLPEGVKAEDVRKVFEKMRNDGPSALSAAERALLQRVRSAGGSSGMRGGGPGGFANRSNGSDNLFGGNYIVFVMRSGQPTAVPVRTGLTDLDYSEVVSGLTPQDTVLLLPSASLVESQREMQERMQRFQSRSLPVSQRN
jgi:HlyD family secretion protein